MVTVVSESWGDEGRGEGVRGVGVIVVILTLQRAIITQPCLSISAKCLDIVDNVLLGNPTIRTLCLRATLAIDVL